MVIEFNSWWVGALTIRFNNKSIRLENWWYPRYRDRSERYTNISREDPVLTQSRLYDKLKRLARRQRSVQFGVYWETPCAENRYALTRFRELAKATFLYRFYESRCRSHEMLARLFWPNSCALRARGGAHNAKQKLARLQRAAWGVRSRRRRRPTAGSGHAKRTPNVSQVDANILHRWWTIAAAGENHSWGNRIVYFHAASSGETAIW